MGLVEVVPAARSGDEETAVEGAFGMEPFEPPVPWLTTYRPESVVGKVPEPLKR